MGIVGTKDPEIGFYLLIGSFRLAVGLGVICDGKANIVLEDSGEFSGKHGSKLWTAIRDKRVM
jgi:hypothetical protein